MPHNDPWNDDTIQFPRLLDEIRAALDPEAYGDHSQLLVDVEESMGLSREQLLDLFNRATTEWERLKGEQEPPPMSVAEALAKTVMDLAAARIEAVTMRDAALELGRQLERDAIKDALDRMHTTDGYPSADWCQWFAERVSGGSSASAAPGSSDASRPELDPSSAVLVISDGMHERAMLIEQAYNDPTSNGIDQDEAVELALQVRRAYRKERGIDDD